MPRSADLDAAIEIIVVDAYGDDEWIHAAYRQYLGLPPFPADPRPDWAWPD
jgi:hypothetical protein